MSRSYFRLIPEVHLFLTRSDQVLMLRRAGTGYMDGYHALVAGHVDGGEPLDVAMCREAREEAGLSLTPAQLRLVHSMHRGTDSGRCVASDERCAFFFACDGAGLAPYNAEPDKCDDMGWFDTTALPDLTVPYVRHAIACIGQGRAFSTFGWPEQEPL